MCAFGTFHEDFVQGGGGRFFTLEGGASIVTLAKETFADPALSVI